MDSSSLIYFLGSNLIFIAAAYAMIHVLIYKEPKQYVQLFLIIVGSAFLSFFASVILKNIIHSPTPDLTNALIVPSDNYGFPSGHATFMFALAFSMYAFDKRAGVLLFTLAVLTGIGRVLAGIHYWYDIVGGLVLGFIISFGVLEIAKRIRVR